MSDARKKRWKLRLIAVMIGVFGALMIGELSVRVLGINPQLNIIFHENYKLSDNPILEYELIPGSPDGRMPISDQGLRDHQYTIPKPENVFRIVVIGDSVTYGLGGQREDTFVKQLESLIDKISPADSPAIEVINLGVAGYNIHQIVERLRLWGLQFQPDLILYAYVLNDPQHFSLESASLKAIQKQVKLDITKTYNDGLTRLLRHSQLYLAIRRATIQLPSYIRETVHDPGFDARKKDKHVEYIRALHTNDESWTRVRKGFSDLNSLSHTPSSIPLVVTLFPIEWKADAQDYPLQDVHEKIMIEAMQNGFDVFDLTDTMSFAQQNIVGRIYNDFLHPSKLGHRICAVSILNFLCGTHRLPNSDEIQKNFDLLKDDPLLEKVLELSP